MNARELEDAKAAHDAAFDDLHNAISESIEKRKVSLQQLLEILESEPTAEKHRFVASRIDELKAEESLVKRMQEYRPRREYWYGYQEQAKSKDRGVRTEAKRRLALQGRVFQLQAERMRRDLGVLRGEGDKEEARVNKRVHFNDDVQIVIIPNREAHL